MGVQGVTFEEDKRAGAHSECEEYDPVLLLLVTINRRGITMVPRDSQTDRG